MPNPECPTFHAPPTGINCHLTGWKFVLALLVYASTAGGCATIRTTDPQHTATEQFLLTSAAQSAGARDARAAAGARRAASGAAARARTRRAAGGAARSADAAAGAAGRRPRRAAGAWARAAARGSGAARTTASGGAKREGNQGREGKRALHVPRSVASFKN